MCIDHCLYNIVLQVDTNAGGQSGFQGVVVTPDLDSVPIRAPRAASSPAAAARDDDRGGRVTEYEAAEEELGGQLRGTKASVRRAARALRARGGAAGSEAARSIAFARQVRGRMFFAARCVRALIRRHAPCRRRHFRRGWTPRKKPLGS